MKKNFYFQSVFDQDLEVITIGEFNNNINGWVVHSNDNKHIE